ncbi:MAG: GDP-mannose 4,6-dehydratase [Candidatus Aenigmarchaeota archaeon]|nr:GDP-mannose 4,6-dehydratase [Candidatus Aenigmarchaeota archaeon]
MGVYAMRLIITGAAGLYGVHMVNALSNAKYTEKIIGVDDFSRNFLSKDPFIDSGSEKFELLKMDYADLDKKKIDEIQPDVVVHLAASVSIPESIDDPWKYFNNNEAGTFRLTQNLLASKTQPTLIYASSPEVYGNPKYVPMDENHPLNPTSTYAVTKLACEKHCMSMWEWYKYPVTVIRNFNTYGENQNLWGYSAVIPAFIQNALRGEPLTIDGDGKQTRDFMYVSDAVNAYKMVIENPRAATGETFNIGTGTDTPIGELAEKILAMTGSKSKVVHRDARLGDLMALRANIDHIKSKLGWSPAVAMDEGLRKTMEWYKRFV